MDAGLATFIVVMTAMVLAAGLLGTWINSRGRARSAGDAVPQLAEVLRENAALKGQVRRLEERLGVLERIATDPSERTAREIEHLR